MSIPTLQDLLEKDGNQKPPYTRQNFIRYLTAIHCLENYEFICDVDKFTKLKDSKDKVKKWESVIKLYLLDDSSKEINLPYQLKHNLLVKLPSSDAIKKSYKIIYELLLDSYNQFINVTKKQNMSSFANHHSSCSSTTTSTSSFQQGLPIPRRGSASASGSSSRRNSLVEFHSNSRKGSSSSTNTASGFLTRSNSVKSPNKTTPTTGSRRPSVSVEYPKSPINNGTTVKSNVVKLPSPQSEYDKKKATAQSSLLKKKFKFRRNSND